MKKFTFTLEKVQKIRVDEQNALKNTLENVDKDIRIVEEALSDLAEKVLREQLLMEGDYKKGVGPQKLYAYELFFESAKAERNALENRRATLLTQKEGLVARLIRLHNELKVLDKSRAAQFEQYRAEVQAAEEKALEGHLAFQAHAAGSV